MSPEHAQNVSDCLHNRDRIALEIFKAILSTGRYEKASDQIPKAFTLADEFIRYSSLDCCPTCKGTQVVTDNIHGQSKERNCPTCI
jgi:hypothetical protein